MTTRRRCSAKQYKARYLKGGHFGLFNYCHPKHPYLLKNSPRNGEEDRRLVNPNFPKSIAFCFCSVTYLLVSELGVVVRLGLAPSIESKQGSLISLLAPFCWDPGVLCGRVLRELVPKHAKCAFHMEFSV